MRQAPAGWTTGTIKFYLPSLRRYARALVQDRDLADSLVRDCLEHAVSRIDLAPVNTDLRVWLLALLHQAHARRSSEPRSATALCRDGDEPAELRVFRAAFDRLATEDRQILLLTGLESLTTEETAAVLGTSTATVRERVARARERLRASERDVAALPAAAVLRTERLPGNGTVSSWLA